MSIQPATQNFYPPVDVKRFELPVQPQGDLASRNRDLLQSHEQMAYQNYTATAVQTAEQRSSFAYWGTFDGTLHFKGVTEGE